MFILAIATLQQLLRYNFLIKRKFLFNMSNPIKVSQHVLLYVSSYVHFVSGKMIGYRDSAAMMRFHGGPAVLGREIFFSHSPDKNKECLAVITEGVDVIRRCMSSCNNL